MAASTVAARSAAEIPVVVRSLASMLTQNAVSNRELLLGTMSGISSSSSRSGVIARQIKPRPYFAMKLMASGVIFSAAMVRSPSFSRSSSSATMTISPARMAAMASSMRAKQPGCLSLGAFTRGGKLLRSMAAQTDFGIAMVIWQACHKQPPGNWPSRLSWAQWLEHAMDQIAGSAEPKKRRVDSLLKSVCDLRCCFGGVQGG